MLKDHAAIFRRLMMFTDLVIVGASFFVGYFIKSKDIYPFAEYAWILPVFIATWGILLGMFGLYRSFRVMDTIDVLLIVFKAAFVGLAIFGSVAYIFKLQFISRIFIAAIFLTATIVITAEKIFLIYLFRSIRKKGYNLRNILIVGTGKRAQHFIDLVHEHGEWGLKIIGIVDEESSTVGQIVHNYKVIGSFSDIPKIIHNNVVDEVVFVVPRSWLNRIEEIMYFCETEGIRVSVAVDYFELKFAKAKQTDLHGFPLLTFETISGKIWHLFMKRFFDILFSGIGLLILLPVFIIIAILIKLTSKGPVFFKQQRSGVSGRKFMLYKFRTMVKNAEAKLKDLEKYNEMSGPVFKMANDPRITPVGIILRKLSLDEFPQLWNVFVGDMSLVGPRPPLPQEVSQYDNWQRRRLSMRPGITCLWQVNGRNKITDFNKWMKLDLEYIDHWSLWLDLRILLQTIPVVLFGIGAK